MNSAQPDDISLKPEEFWALENMFQSEYLGWSHVDPAAALAATRLRLGPWGHIESVLEETWSAAGASATKTSHTIVILLKIWEQMW